MISNSILQNNNLDNKPIRESQTVGFMQIFNLPMPLAEANVATSATFWIFCTALCTPLHPFLRFLVSHKCLNDVIVNNRAIR